MESFNSEEACLGMDYECSDNEFRMKVDVINAAVLGCTVLTR